MRKSKYDKLNELVNAPFKVSGIRKHSQEERMLCDILWHGKAYTGYYQGSGRWSKAVDLTEAIHLTLENFGIAHEVGNDAPRGGVSGNYVKVTMPAFLKEVAKVQAIHRERVLAEQKAEAEKQAKREAHRKWVVEQAEKFDLEPYREDIMKMLETRLGVTEQEKEYRCHWLTNKLSRRERGKITWWLIHEHKGINADVLNEALCRFEF